MLLDCLVSLLSPGPQMSQVITILPSRLRPWVTGEFADRSVVLDSTSKLGTPKGGEYMPLTAAPWWHFSRATVESDRDDPGVYEMGDASDSVVYIGSSDALKRRLKEQLSESGTCIRKNTVRYRIEYTKDYQARERQLYDKHIKIHGKPPKCNEPPARVPGSL